MVRKGLVVFCALLGVLGVFVSRAYASYTRASHLPVQTDQAGDHQSGAINAGDVRFESITSADGLSFPIVRSITQDTLGYMWFATENGLNKFDGHTFTNFKSHPATPDSLRFDEQSVIFRDSLGTLWIGGSGGLEKYEAAYQRFVSVFTDARVNAITEDSKGVLWVGSDHGLYGFNQDANTPVYAFSISSPGAVDTQKLSSGKVQALLADAQGSLWVGTSSGLDRLSPSRTSFTHYRHEPHSGESPQNNDILALFEDSHGKIWIGTAGGGLASLDRDTGIFTRYFHDPDNPASLSANTVNTILEDRSGSLWVGTINGLNQRLPGSLQFLRYRHASANPFSLSDNTVHDIYEDRSGVLWIATANGISRYVPRTNQFKALRWPQGDNLFSSVAAPPDLAESKVLSIFEGQDGKFWFGTMLDGLLSFDSETGQVQTYQHEPDHPNSLISNQVSAIFQDHVGVFWLGTGDGWLEQFNPVSGMFLHATQQESAIISITEDRADNLWLGTQGNGLSHFKFDDQFLSDYNDPSRAIERDPIGANVVEALFVDQIGDTWIGTANNGIQVWDQTRAEFRSYRHDPADPTSLSHNHVIAFLEESHQLDDVPADTVWIGTMGGGLNRLDLESGTFKHYTTRDGLADDIVNCILKDNQGLLWLSTPKGLTRFDPVSETFRNYDETDGYSSGASHPGVCLRSQAGLLYFGTPNGIIYFDPDLIEDNLHPPPVVITSLRVNNQEVARDIFVSHDLRLSHWENQLAFEFTALDFTAPQKNQYAYQLVGQDADWVFAGTRRYADYPNLDPGDYIFRLRGSNNDGVWNETGLTVRITITPPFWTRAWFIALLFGTLVGGLLVGVRWRTRSLAERSRMLEGQIVERTAEIDRRRRQVEALYQADENLYRHLDLDEVLQALVDTAVQLLHADKGALLCWDQAEENLVIRAARGFSPQTIARVQLPRGQGVSGWVVEHKQPAVVTDVRRDDRVTHSIVDAEGIRAFIQVPIMIEDHAFGVFSADYLYPHQFTQENEQLLVSLAERAAVAIQNAQRYSQAHETAAAEERIRLARDLHDAVTQTLFSASLIAEALPALWERDPVKGRDRLAKLRQMSRGALAEMRALLLELRPAALMEAEMSILLHQLAEAVTGREGIPVAVQVELSCDLPADLHIALYRIAQEALNNVAKHARATQVRITLHSTCDPPTHLQELQLSIADNGLGFTPAEVPADRMGLIHMHERSEAVGARLTVHSTPGQGTRISVWWPAQDIITSEGQPSLPE